MIRLPYDRKRYELWIVQPIGSDCIRFKQAQLEKHLFATLLVRFPVIISFFGQQAVAFFDVWSKFSFMFIYTFNHVICLASHLLWISWTAAYVYYTFNPRNVYIICSTQPIYVVATFRLLKSSFPLCWSFSRHRRLYSNVRCVVEILNVSTALERNAWWAFQPHLWIRRAVFYSRYEHIYLLFY